MRKKSEKSDTDAQQGAGRVNHAALHRDELVAAIESATVTELHAIDADLAREGWDPSGTMRSRITARLAEPPSSSAKSSAKSSATSPTSTQE